MDKYEYKLKMDQMKSLTAEKRYKEAAEIADTISWHKIKNVNDLLKAGEIYEMTGRFEESQEILLLAYDRSPIGRMIIYRLAQVAIKKGNYEEAKDYYQEFVEIAPHDNLKYVLKYEISKAQGAHVSALITILEELKEQEYSEEWAYELAYLYHKAGMSDKCIEACDELILWFGEGPYVERALELKMLYQPLSRQQEEKYRQFRLKEAGIVEVKPEDILESGEIVKTPVQIPKVQVSAERFNTQNLQEELQKSMQQIMNATEKEAVEDGMDNIKKLVEDIPYLQIPKEELPYSDDTEQPHIETDEEIDNSLKNNFKELLAEDYDGQMRLFVPERGASEPQVSGQMSIEDVLAEWEKTKRAAEAALQEAEQRKLESAKARALQEAGDIMGRLVDVIPKLNSGLTPKELLEEQYLGGQPIEDDKAAEMVANMNQILQQEIDRLSNENAQMDQQIAEAGLAVFPDEAAGLTAFPDEAAGLAEDIAIAEAIAETGLAAGVTELVPDVELPEITFPEDLQEPDGLSEESGLPEENEFLEESGLPEENEFLEIDKFPETGQESFPIEEELIPNLQTELESHVEEELFSEPIEDTVESEESDELPEIAMPEDLEQAEEPSEFRQDELPEIAEVEEEAGSRTVKKLSEEQKELFSYFVSVRGMEKQLCQAMTGTIRRLMSGRAADTGNLIIQGGSGCGKTALAVNMIKTLQKETGMLTGRTGKIDASMLNQRDAAELLDKVAGGCLIIEKAGGISREMAIRLSQLLANDRSGVLVIIEDSPKGIEKALSKDASFAARFSEKINIPILTSDELVTFAKSYAKELGYTIEEMGVLALYNSISNIQKLDQATTLTEVREIVDQAIAKAEKGTLRKAFSIFASRRYDEDDYIILHEKDFDL